MTARVGCNLLWLVPGRVGGSETYAVRLLEAWAEGGGRPGLELTLLANRRVAAAHPGLLARFDHDVAPVGGGSRPARVATESTWLAATARRRRLDLVHHLGGTVPAVAPCPSVVTVHDLQPWALPANFHPVKRAYLRWAVPSALRRARLATTLSGWVRADLAARLGADPARVAVVPPGVDVAPPGAGPAPAGVDVAPAGDAVLARLGLGDRPFFLYPAVTYAHKGHLDLVRAFRPVAERHPRAVLVLAGGAGPVEGDLARLVTALGLGGQVCRVGRVPDGDLDVLYRRATALAYPSTYEGFGLPVLEAMARGCAVVASSAAALPEAVGEGGVLLPPGDAGAWAAELGRLLDDEGHGARLRARARAGAAGRPWSAAVDGMAEAYRRALAGPGGPGAVAP